MKWDGLKAKCSPIYYLNRIQVASNGLNQYYHYARCTYVYKGIFYKLKMLYTAWFFAFGSSCMR